MQMSSTPELSDAGHIPRTIPWQAHVPLPLFGAIMGLFGLTLAVHAAAPLGTWSGPLSLGLMALSGLAFSGAAGLYGWKALRVPAAVAEDWAHPVRSAFFPAVAISALLLATALLPYAPTVARGVWVVGAAAQGALALALISRWIGPQEMPLAVLSPVWFIPAVGNIVVPLAGAKLGYVELSWLFLAAGLGFWAILLPLVFHRKMFHAPLPPKLHPSVAILVAPPSVAALALLALLGEATLVGKVLVDLGYVFAALAVLSILQRRPFPPFALSWWAVTFPTAALCAASFRYGVLEESPGRIAVGALLLIALSLMVGALSVRTVRAFARNEIFQPE